MKLEEMQKCAAETLAFFIKTMPDAPFTENDIIFAFAKKSEMASRALELCTKYCPEKVFTDSQPQQRQQRQQKGLPPDDCP